MIKLLIGGSPCTHWSIARTTNRETTPSGIGWELFKNYLIAKEKFCPDLFLYENNQSAAQPIREQIAEELGVELMYINSALVSPQNRKRFYAFNWQVPQPKDRGILLTDILVGNTQRIASEELIKIPPMIVAEATSKGYTEINAGDCVDLTMPKSKTRRGRNMKDKCNCLTKTNAYYQYCGTVDTPIYKVENGLITIEGKDYPVKLHKDYHIIRKLSVAECCRLQTLPDDYCRAVSDPQAYKGLGNGWTAEVIIHILQGALADIDRNEKIVVLSMYDGIGTGRYCLDQMGFKNVDYYAYEIDKHAIAIALDNYPDIIQCGDAFDLRDYKWSFDAISTSGHAKGGIE